MKRLFWTALTCSFVSFVTKSLQASDAPLPNAVGGCKDAEHLVGFYWNGSAEEMRLINTCTGVSQLLGIVKGLRRLSWASSDVDRHRHQIYMRGNDHCGAQGPYRIYSIDTTTAETTSAQLDETWVWFFRTRNDGTIVGLNRVPLNAGAGNSTGELELRSIDAMTGSTTLLGTIPDVSVIQLRNDPIDR